MGDIINFPGDNNPVSSEHLDFEEMLMKRAEQEKAGLTEEMHQQLLITDEIDPDELFAVTYRPEVAAFKLHLELEHSSVENNDALDDHQIKLLKKYGKVNESISRDIIVPANMTLHALHFAIQKAFGWQHCHLFQYSLSEEDFNLVTAGRFDTYADLCGILFRFPDEQFDDFWDDDYENEMNFDHWLRSKYCGPYIHGSASDVMVENYSNAIDMLYQLEERKTSGKRSKKKDKKPEWAEGLSKDSYLADIGSRIMMGAPWNNLMKIRSVGSIFNIYSEENERLDVHRWKAAVMQDKADTDEMLNHAYQSGEYSEEQLMRMFMLAAVEPVPYFNAIYYNYDFGDDWRVKITAADYYINMLELDDFDEDDFDDWDDFDEDDFDDNAFPEEYIYVNSRGEQVDDDLNELIQNVDIRMHPACVAADGLNVCDDCGNVWGYVEMLETIHGKDREAAADMKAWAKMQGWTGRAKKPERML